MTDLILIGFDEPYKADEAMARVQKMADDGLVDVERVAVVVRGYGGKTDYRTTTPLPGAGEGAVAGGLWGALLGMIAGMLFAPATGGASAVAGVTAAGTAMGAAAGAITGGLTKDDFDDEFKRDLELLMHPGTSVLIIIVNGARRRRQDELLPRLHALGGTVLKTNLPPEAEAKLQRALAESA
jgi:uncharacterized membrane protein